MMRSLVRAAGAACVVGVALLLPELAIADTPDSVGQLFVPGVLGAFNGLSPRADAIVMARGATPQASLCKHYQGLARKNGSDGTPYFILTKSGNVPTGCGLFVDPAPGYLIVGRMGSREQTGERLRTNFLPYDTPLVELPILDVDKGITGIPLNGSSGFPAYRHPGGMQLLGDVLAIGVENPFGSETVRATILFIGLSDPENPTLLSRFDPPDLGGSSNEEFGADPVGLTAVKAPGGSCCRYLMIVAGGPGNKEVRFFRSLSDPGVDTTDLKSGALAWEQVGRYSESQIESCLGADWPSGLGTQHQMLNFVRESNLDGQLYLVGGLRDGAVINPFADERLDLYRVNVSADGVPQSCPLTHLRSKTMSNASWGGFTNVGSFAAGSGVYISPSGELIVYGSNHETTAGDTIILGEYRLGSLVRANSPTLRPTAKLALPFAVDEGSSVTLTGSANPPITKAFVQVFGDEDVGLESSGWPWMTVEYDTRAADAFDQFDYLHQPASDISEEATSWRWFAPPGCTISANDYPVRSDEFPGPDTVQLRGTGQFEEALDLSSLAVYQPSGAPYPVSPVPSGATGTQKNYNDDVGGVTFYEAWRENGNLMRNDGCEAYYGAGYLLGWDLDGNGTFESSGTSVSFSAAALDGPTTASIQARARHATDTTPIGTGAIVPAGVVVRNVAPLVTATLRDSLGHDLDGGTRVAIVGLPVTLAASFTDPGLADTQTAQIDWGDGTPLDTSFGTFSDARNGATGTLVDSHAYATGGTLVVAASIKDDDGGTTVKQFTITVMSIEDAIGSVVDALNARIATTANARIRSALIAARDELTGNLGGTPPTNGALDKLEQEDPIGAITKLKASIEDLLAAEGRGAGDLSALEDLLGLAAEAIAMDAWSKAQIAVAPPSRGEAQTLAAIGALIAQGDDQLAAGNYLAACDSFRTAASKALGLMP